MLTQRLATKGAAHTDTIGFIPVAGYELSKSSCVEKLRKVDCMPTLYRIRSHILN